MRAPASMPGLCHVIRRPSPAHLHRPPRPGIVPGLGASPARRPTAAVSTPAQGRRGRLGGGRGSRKKEMLARRSPFPLVFPWEPLFL